MAIIKAQDFAKVQRGELTIQELKQRNEQTASYDKERNNFRQKLNEFSAGTTNKIDQKNEIFRLKNKVMLLVAYNKRAEGEILRLRRYFEQENNKNKNTQLKLELLRKRIEKEQSYKEEILAKESLYQKDRRERELLLKKAKMLADNLALQLDKKQQDLNLSVSESEKLQKQILSEQVVLRKTEYELNLLKSAHEMVQQELNNEKNKNIENSGILAELNEKLKVSETAGKKTNAELIQLQEQLNLANAKKNELTEKLNESLLTQETLTVKLEETQTLIEETEKKLNGLQEEQTQSLKSGELLRTEIIELKDQLTAAEKRIAETDTLAKADQEKLSNQELEINNLKETLSNDRGNLKQEIVYLKEQLMEAEEDLAVFNRQQQMDQDYINNFEEELTAFKNTIRQDKEAITRSNREIARLNQKIEEIEKGTTDKVIENTTLKKEVATLKRKIDLINKKEAELIEAEEEIAALGYEQRYYQEQINSSEHKIALIQKKLSKHELIGRKILEMLKELYETPELSGEVVVMTEPTIRYKKELENSELKDKIALLKDGRDEKKVIKLENQRIKEKKAKVMTMTPMLFTI